MATYDFQDIVGYGTFVTLVEWGNNVSQANANYQYWKTGGQYIEWWSKSPRDYGLTDIIWQSLKNNEPVQFIQNGSGGQINRDVKTVARSEPVTDLRPAQSVTNIEITPKSEGGTTTKIEGANQISIVNDNVIFIPGVTQPVTISRQIQNKTSIATTEGTSFSDKIGGSSTFGTKINAKVSPIPKIFEISAEASDQFQQVWEKVTQVNYSTTATNEEIVTDTYSKSVDLARAKQSNPQLDPTKPAEKPLYEWPLETGETLTLVPGDRYVVSIKFKQDGLSTDIKNPVKITGTSGNWIYSLSDFNGKVVNYQGVNPPYTFNGQRVDGGPNATLTQQVQTALNNGYLDLHPELKAMNLKVEGNSITADYSSVATTRVASSFRTDIVKYVDGSAPKQSMALSATDASAHQTDAAASIDNGVNFNLSDYNVGLPHPTGIDLDLKNEKGYGSKLINVSGTQYGDIIEGADGNHSLSHFSNAVITLGNGDNKIVLAVGENENTIKVGNGNNNISIASDGNDITLGQGKDTVTISGQGKNYVHLNGGADTIKFDSKDAVTVVTGWNYKTDKIDFGSNVDLSQTRVIYNAYDTHLYVYVGDKLIAKMLADHDALPAVGSSIVSQDLVAKGVVEINLQSGVDTSVLETYQSVFGRLPDNNGFNFWEKAYSQNNMTITDLAKTFLASKEAEGSGLNKLSDEAFASKIYQQTFDNTPNADALSSWTGLLQSGISRADLVVAMATTDESINLIGGHTYNGMVPLA